MDQQECTHCHGATMGYKCDMCGAESGEHDAMHGCGGDRCMPKCTECNEAQAKCSCPPAAA